MDGSEFRRLLLQTANGRADDDVLATLRTELRGRFEVGETTFDDGRGPRTCPACDETIEEPTLPQHISAGCPALK